MSNVIRLPLHGIEDNLLDIGALVKFGLFALENSEDGELPRLKGDFVTLLYLIQEKVQAGQSNMSEHVRRRKGRGYE